MCEIDFDEKVLKKRPSKKYEFPTGFNTSFGPDRYRIAESFFNPFFKVGENHPDVSQVTMGLNSDVNMVVDNVQGNISSGLPTIPQLLQASLSKCDQDLRPILHSNVVLTGGQTVF
jgi:actin-related protein